MKRFMIFCILLYFGFLYVSTPLLAHEGMRPNILGVNAELAAGSGVNVH